MDTYLWTTTALAGKQPLRGVRKGFRRTLTGFRRDESGVLEKPMVATLLCMLAVGGIGIDVVRHERDRTYLQYTLDRAVLAAADLDQPLAPEEVVFDYLTKAGLEEYYSTPETEVSPTSKRVSASVDADFETHWMKFANFTGDLPLTASATAEESIGNVEISLVLDVSGSMGSNKRLVNLKKAAKDFVQTMANNTEPDKMSISIVPYSTQVSLPDALIDQLNTSADSQYSNCINFSASDYNTTAISTLQQYERTMHFSVWGSSDYRTKTRYVAQAVCASHQDNPERTVLMLQDNVTTLQDYIDDFEAGENTSLDIGMKWGVALLDPTMQPLISNLTTGTAPLVAPKFANRPVSHSDHETLKVVVLMTDGENTYQPYIHDDYREGGSTVWYNTVGKVYSTYDATRSGSKKYYWHDISDSGWYDHPYGAGSYTKTEDVCTSWRSNGSCRNWTTKTTVVDEPGNASNVSELSYADLFADTSLQYIYYYLFYDWMDYYAARDKWYYDVYESVEANAKDSRTLAICEAAKDAGIVVFTIGFEAPSAGQAVLAECASSDSHYYDVKGLEISDAFASIASAIRQLRLTE